VGYVACVDRGTPWDCTSFGCDRPCDALVDDAACGLRADCHSLYQLGECDTDGPGRPLQSCELVFDRCLPGAAFCSDNVTCDRDPEELYCPPGYFIAYHGCPAGCVRAEACASNGVDCRIGIGCPSNGQNCSQCSTTEWQCIEVCA